MSVRTFLLPDLGEGLTEAELVNWLVAVGDTVAVDQPVAEVETAKSLVEVPSPFAGRVAQLHGTAGQSVDVGRPLISVDTAAADVPAPAQSPAAEAYRQEERAGSGNVLIGYGTAQTDHGPRRRRSRRTGTGTGTGTRSAAAATVGWAAGPPAGPPAGPRAGQPASPGQAIQQSEADNLGAVRCVSPIVRRMAREAGLRLANIPGSGADGLILRRDVEAVLTAVAAARTAPEQQTGTGQATTSPPSSGTVPGGQSATEPVRDRDARTGLDVASRTPVRGLRRAAVSTLARSRSLIPEATVWVEADATALMDLRADLAAQGTEAPSLLAFLARFTLAGLARFPELNTRYVPAGADGQAAGSGGQDACIEAFDGVNLGIAVQTGRGLMVPSVRRADALSTRDLDAGIRRLTAAAQAGKATPAELSSGTFTLNNYGVFGVDGSAAIINYPESAILGVGRIIDKPWVVRGELAVRKMTELTLVFDHRVCDGGTAGGFLRYVADAVENPARVLADV